MPTTRLLTCMVYTMTKFEQAGEGATGLRGGSHVTCDWAIASRVVFTGGPACDQTHTTKALYFAATLLPGTYIQSQRGQILSWFPFAVKCVEGSFHNQGSSFVVMFLGGLSLHLNHLIASRMANYDWPFGTLPFGLFWSNLDTRDLETYPRTYSDHFWNMSIFDDSRAIWVLFRKWVVSENQFSRWRSDCYPPYRFSFRRRGP